MNTHRVVFPPDDWVVVKFRQEGHPGVAVVNRALAGFEPKEVFTWHLSIIVHLDDIAQNGLPSAEETVLLENFESTLCKELAVSESPKPNGLFLARISWNGTRELIYRIFDAEHADRALKALIELRSHPRPLDYRMDNDPHWAMAEWHLGAAAGDTRAQGS